MWISLSIISNWHCSHHHHKHHHQQIRDGILLRDSRVRCRRQRGLDELESERDGGLSYKYKMKSSISEWMRQYNNIMKPNNLVTICKQKTLLLTVAFTNRPTYHLPTYTSFSYFISQSISFHSHNIFFSYVIAI